MVNILWFFLPGILALGVITSYTDIKFGKIKNWAIIGAIAYAILAYLIVGLLGYDVFSLDLFTNALFALAVGAGFWLLGLWSAADGKLFFAFALLVPLGYYWLGYEQLFPSLTLLFNTFIPFFLFSFFLVIIKSSFKEKKDIIKATSITQVVLIILSIFAVQWISEGLFVLFRLPYSFFLEIILFFILILVLNKALRKYFNHFIFLLCILRVITSFELVFTFDFLANFVAFTAVYFILRLAIINLGFSVYTKKVLVKDLKEGDVLAVAIQKQGKKYLQKPLTGLFSSEKSIIKMSPEGLKGADIVKFKKLGIPITIIHETLPFAPFIFFGVILNLLVEGNIIYFIYLLLQQI